MRSTKLRRGEDFKIKAESTINKGFFTFKYKETTVNYILNVKIILNLIYAQYR